MRNQILMLTTRNRPKCIFFINLFAIRFHLILIVFVKFTFSQHFNIYFGDLHSHTSYSDGSQTPSFAYTHARNSGVADFLAITDHSWFSDSQWNDTYNAALLNTTPSFLALRGFEMTTSWGHMNVYNTQWFLSYATMANFYEIISLDTNCIAQWNHPTEYSNEFENFTHYSEKLDKVINLIEIRNSKRYMKFDSSYVKALDKGWHVSPTANSDMHSTGWITGYDWRTAILADSLSKDCLFTAIRNHRTYATEDRNLHVFFSVNNSPMGSILTNPTHITVELRIFDPDTFYLGDKIRLVEIFSRNGQIRAAKECNDHEIFWKYTLQNNNTENNYYFVKVTNLKGNTAITAPVWIEYNKEIKPANSVISKRQQLYDLSGRTVESRQIQKTKKESGSISSGVYIDLSNSKSILKVKK